MLVTSIHVRLTKGKFASQNQLHGLIKKAFPREISPRTKRRRAAGIRQYIADMSSVCIFTCIPCPGTLASFLWLNDRMCEIVIETFPNGNLLESAGLVVGTVCEKLKVYNLKARFNITVHSLDDSQIYMLGNQNTMGARFRNEFKDNLVGLFIAGLLVIIAKLWLTDFYDDARAALITLLCFSLWEFYDKVLKGKRSQPIVWRVSNAHNPE